VPTPLRACAPLAPNPGADHRPQRAPYSRSNTVAMPWPPPMHIVTSA
jgi:hypothetical protein